MNPRTRRIRRLRRRERKKMVDEKVRASLSMRVGLRELERQQRHYLSRYLDVALRFAEEMERRSEVAQGEETKWHLAAALAARKLGTSHPDAPNQDVASYEILQRLVERINKACLRAGWEPLSGPVVGTLARPDVNAFCAAFFGSTALIVLHSSVLVFAQLLAKCVVPAICARTSEHSVVLGGDPDEKQFRRAACRLAQLISAIQSQKGPSSAPPYTPAPTWLFWSIVQCFVESIEMFVVAHEYGHLMVSHGKHPFGDGEISPKSEELCADFFAMSVAILDQHIAHPEIRVIAPLVMFKVFSLMERDGVVVAPTSHPLNSQRLHFLRDEVLEGLADQEQPWLARILKVNASVEARIEKVWAAATVERDILWELEDLLERCVGDAAPDYRTFNAEVVYILDQVSAPHALQEVAIFARTIADQIIAPSRASENVLDDWATATKVIFQKYKLLRSVVPNLSEPMQSVLKAELER